MIAGKAAAALFALATLVFLLLLFQPVRNMILVATVARVSNALSGDVTVERALWPKPGTLDLTGIRWVDGADTLVAAGHVKISVGITSLFHRDLRVSSLEVTGLWADIPAVTNRLASSDTTAVRESTKPAEGAASFPRGGALPGVPSIAIEQIDIGTSTLRISEEVEFQHVALADRVNLLQGTLPVLQVDELSFRERSGIASIEKLQLTVDLDARDFSGHGKIRLAPEVSAVLTLRSLSDDTFVLHIAGESGREPPESPGCVLKVRFERDSGRIRTVFYAGRFLTPDVRELASLPLLASALANLPPLEGIGGNVDGQIDLSGNTVVTSRILIDKNAWLDSATVSLTLANGTLSADSLDFRFPDLALEGSGSASSSGASVRASIQVEGNRWLEHFAPDVEPPENVSASINLEADGFLGALQSRVHIEGSAAVSDFRLDRMVIDAVVPGAADGTIAIGLSATTMGTTLRTHADITRGNEVVVRLSPLDPGADNGGFRGPESCSLSGVVRYDSISRIARLETVRLTGALGDYVVNAALDSLRRGEFDVSCEWPFPPALLSEHTAFRGVSWDSLTAAWRPDGPFQLTAVGALGKSSPENITITGSMKLPGPKHLLPLTDGSIDVHDLGPVEGDFFFEKTACDSGRFLRGWVDLARTSWIDTAVVAGGGCGEAVSLDSLLLSLEGLRLHASGTVVDDSPDLLVQLSLPEDAPLLQRLRGIDDEQLRLGGQVRTHIGGTRDRLRISADAELSVASSVAQAPRLKCQVDWSDEGIRASVDAVDGIVSRFVRLDRLTINYRGTDVDSLLPGTLEIAATGSDLAYYHSMRLARDDGFLVQSDTLGLAINDLTLKTVNHFGVRYRPAQKTDVDSRNRLIQIDDLHLAGSIGEIRIDGYATADSADMDMDVLVGLPPMPSSLALGENLWPDSARVSVRARGAFDLAAKGRVSGVALVENDGPVTVSFDVDSSPAGARAAMDIASTEEGGDTLLHVDASIPEVEALLNEARNLSEQPVQIDLRFSGFPLLNRTALAGSKTPYANGRLYGRLSVRGPIAVPSAYAAIECVFETSKQLSEYRLTVEGQFAGTAGLDTALTDMLGRGVFDYSSRNEVASNATAAPGSDASTTSEPLPEFHRDQPGVVAALSLTKSGRPELTGSLSYPLMWSTDPLGLRVVEKGQLRLDLESETLDLADLNELLPPNLSIDGTCAFDFSMKGDIDDPVLDGSLEATGVDLSQSKGANVSLDVKLRIGGSANKPLITGDVLVHSGVILMPESSDEMLPTQGASYLLSTNDSTLAHPDTILAGPGSGRSPADTSLAAGGNRSHLPDLDINLRIPGGLWIRGKRLQIEMSGDLHILQEDGNPALTGELTAGEGRFRFLGRQFEFERGLVEFHGDEAEINPSLDLELSCVIDDVTVTVKVMGTVQEPTLELSSDPAMDEADIMSLLLFGKMMDDLNTDQSNMLLERAVGVFAVYGAAKLESQLSNQIGIDVVSFTRSTREPDQSALVVGKYLNRKLLLKYEQNLKDTASYLINLEYYLNRRLTLETFRDQDSERGLEIHWSKHY